ncbi:MAG: hypothetical protein ABSA50_08420 [Candidatus Bathyarchaeia archaeon]|jgi:hypothetical protein
MFEHRKDPLISRAAFLKRVVRYALIAFAIDAGSLAVGVIGYHVFEGLSWVDSLLNAAMLLGGMGPVNELHTTSGKLFASFYAIYCGVIFLVVAGILLAPIIHRFIHHFHLEADSST